MEYLQWYRKVLALPIENEKTLHFILPENDILALKIDFETLYSRKIILATGRGGFGGFRDVSYVQNLPQGTYAHTTENIDFSALHGKKVAIIGAGASGFDAANAALIKGASVDIIVRRPHLPFINKAASLTYSGFSEGYYHLSDKERWEIMNLSYEEGTPPPYEALERVKDNKQFKVKLATHIEDIFWKDNHIHLNTTKGVFQYDFIILATGFAVQGLKQPELASFVDKIFLWKDREEIKLLDGFQSFFQSPYLGAHFQFLEKQSGLAPFLKNIYCFNYAATLSHGLSDYYINQLKHYRAPEFEESSYHFWEY
jgi:cation diffusion facilitator CzcD-associated flavoprotein CzcO